MPVRKDISLARLFKIIRRRLGRPFGVATRALKFRLGLEPARDPVVFCIGMQRSGTTSFGNFCADTLGLKRRGFDISIANEWTRAWMEGRHERIFASPDFRTTQVFEDDPWWCPDYYKVLAPRFPGAKFVLITRDSAKWFRSLKAHSGGKSLGHTDLHVAIYGRADEFEALKADARKSGIPFKKINWQGLSLEGWDDHYKAAYEAHTAAATAWFAEHAPDRFLHIDLDDPDKFRKVAVFLGYEDKEYADVRVNAIATP